MPKITTILRSQRIKDKRYCKEIAKTLKLDRSYRYGFMQFALLHYMREYDWDRLDGDALAYKWNSFLDGLCTSKTLNQMVANPEARPWSMCEMMKVELRIAVKVERRQHITFVAIILKAYLNQD